MNQTLTNLCRVAHEIGLGEDNERAAQRGVYLAHAKGVNLRYRFEPGTRGPHSRDLARDLAELGETPPETRREIAGRELAEPYRSALAEVRNLCQAPEETGLGQEQWLNLVAETDYLQRTRGMGAQALRDAVQVKMPQASQHLETAIKALAEAGINPLAQAG